jgi:DMSO/TMAO reductase YedYZ heme-binding membrane subunit
MHRVELLKRDELMKADLFSEIVLLGSGVAIMVAFLIVVLAAVTSAAAMR